MNKLIGLDCNQASKDECAIKLSGLLQEKCWVQLTTPKDSSGLISESISLEGSGVVLASSGSTGGTKHCFQPCSHLDQSAEATSIWLQRQGVEVTSCVLFNPLPIHHISGLMLWWRSLRWGASHFWLDPQWMRDPVLLEKFCTSFFQTTTSTCLIALVPTQLRRLLSHPSGLNLLKSFALIWIGGAYLPEDLASQARSEGLRLSPCYGATETAAMVTAMTPEDFLAGQEGCGSPLPGVNLRLSEKGALEVQTSRLATFYWLNGELRTVCSENGWWQSGDYAEILTDNLKSHLRILGRVDFAINSGGETVFIEQLEARISKDRVFILLPIKYILLIPVDDVEWGQRLAAMIRFDDQVCSDEMLIIKQKLLKIVGNWMPQERPIEWYSCPELAPDGIGKWNRNLWISWLKKNFSTAILS